MKKRLDIFLVDNNYFETRQKAKANIMAGKVYVDGKIVDKAGTNIKESSKIYIKSDTIPYVSRGGLKLEKAMEVFNLDLGEKICMDIGASTGGFTDCMLQNSAKKVYSIDVGYGQLDYKLRKDERVVCLERTNFRHIDNNLIKEKIDFASIDVSFISLKLIFPTLKNLINTKFDIVSLIKPQFEAGKKEADKYKGVIKDTKVFKKVIIEVLNSAVENDFFPKNLTFSPIKGQKGNIEFLVHLTGNKADYIDENIIEKVILDATSNL